MKNRITDDLKAILFDLDDTLISYDGVSGQAWDISCTEFLRGSGLDIPKAELIGAIDKTRRWYWSDAERHRHGRKDICEARRNIVGIAFSWLGIDDRPLSDTLADLYSATHDRLVYVYPQSCDILSHYRGRGYKLGLVTNGTGEGQRGKLKRFGLEDCFDAVFIEGEVGVGKPDPAIFVMVLEDLGVQPREAVMIGDNPVWDIASPASLGINTVWIDKNSKGNPGEGIAPDLTVGHISHLIDVL